MQLGAEAVFVGSGIFMKDSTTFADPEEAEKRAKAQSCKPPRTTTTQSIT
jgi:pyridoxal biosynthesis lyase PdxS